MSSLDILATAAAEKESDPMQEENQDAARGKRHRGATTEQEKAENRARVRKHREAKKEAGKGRKCSQDLSTKKVSSVINT